MSIRNRPSILLTVPTYRAPFAGRLLFLRNIMPQLVISTIRVIAIEKGISLFSTTGSTLIGLRIAQMPRIPRRLKRLEPTTLLIAISLDPCKAADILTASSGALD